MTGLPFYEGFAPASLRALGACIESAAQELVEPTINVEQMARQRVDAVIPHRDGYRLCFASGLVVHINRGATFDVSGNAVIEP